MVHAKDQPPRENAYPVIRSESEFTDGFCALATIFSRMRASMIDGKGKLNVKNHIPKRIVFDSFRARLPIIPISEPEEDC